MDITFFEDKPYFDSHLRGQNKDCEDSDGSSYFRNFLNSVGKLGLESDTCMKNAEYFDLGGSTVDNLGAKYVLGDEQMNNDCSSILKLRANDSISAVRRLDSQNYSPDYGKKRFSRKE